MSENVNEAVAMYEDSTRQVLTTVLERKVTQKPQFVKNSSEFQLVHL